MRSQVTSTPMKTALRFQGASSWVISKPSFGASAAHGSNNICLPLSHLVYQRSSYLLVLCVLILYCVSVSIAFTGLIQQERLTLTNVLPSTTEKSVRNSVVQLHNRTQLDTIRRGTANGQPTSSSSGANEQMCTGNSTKEPITVGYLTNFFGRHSLIRQGLVISGAVLYAIDHINKERPELLNCRPLKMIYNDTSATSVNGTAALISQWRQGAKVFFGPEDTCDVEATIAAALNLPMISYKCANPGVVNKDQFSTFVRTNPPDGMVSKPLLELLRFFQWSKFAIVWHKRIQKFAPVVSHLRSEAEKYNKTGFRFHITVDYPFEDDFECCIKKESCCGQVWSDLVDNTFKLTRIYVFFGGGSTLPYFLLALKAKGVLDEGEYVVISVDIEEDYIDKENAYRFINQRTDLAPHENAAIYNAAAGSLLVLAKTPPEPANFSYFEEKVREYNQLPPFTLSDSMTMKRHITYYAAYLYDSVVLYAEALSQVFKEGLNENHGRSIINKIISRKRYQSITGAWMQIDKHGCVEGNYSVLQPVLGKKKHYRSLPSVEHEDESHSVRPMMDVDMNRIGMFVYKNNEDFDFNQINPVNWLRPGHVPLDEPPCGFDGKLCDKSELKVRELVCALLSSVLLVTTFVCTIIYRNWKYEQEIDGLLWKISSKDIIFDEDRLKALSISRASLMSNSSLNYFRIKDSLSFKLGHYKKSVIVLKEFHFNKQKKGSVTNAYDYLSRDNKKDMKMMKDMRHSNINPFIGAYIHPMYPFSVFTVSEYCSKGSLKDVLEDEDMKLNEDHLASLIYALMSAIAYLHKSEMKCHGNLKSTNCLITSRWVLKVTDFGLHELRQGNAETDSSSEEPNYYKLLWKAPEVLRCTKKILATAEADIYAFGIILHEMVIRKGPFAILSAEDKTLLNGISKQIVDKVTAIPMEGCEPFRPNTVDLEINNDVIDIMKYCWHEDAASRPNIEQLRSKFKMCKKFPPPTDNIMDNMMKLMEMYQGQLEVLVDKRTQQLNEEKKKTESLLNRMLPESVAKQLVQGEKVIPEAFNAVTIFFSDIVGFTSLSAISTPMEVVSFLNDLYTLFDQIISYYDVYKVETIGDAYMVVSGLPIRNGDDHCTEIASMALEMLEAIKNFKIRHREEELLQLRIGIHTGPVVAGIVGLKMPRYCLFGDTVNTASRMESNGQALKIHISSDCKNYLEPTGKYIIEERGLVKMKGKGEVCTYWLKGHVEGPQPRVQGEYQYFVEDTPWLIKEKVTKPKPHISFLDEEIIVSARKSSLVPNEKSNYNSMIKKSFAHTASLLMVTNPYSNSCSSFRQPTTNEPTSSSGPAQSTQPQPTISPKPNKRNWNLSHFFQGKIRSQSTNQPEDTPLNQILLKESKIPKSIIKSPSCNTIEALTRLTDFKVDANELNEFKLKTSPRPSANRRLCNPTSSNLAQSFTKESNLDELIMEENSDSSNEKIFKNDDFERWEEEQPLLSDVSMLKEDEDSLNETSSLHLNKVNMYSAMTNGNGKCNGSLSIHCDSKSQLETNIDQQNNCPAIVPLNTRNYYSPPPLTQPISSQPAEPVSNAALAQSIKSSNKMISPDGLSNSSNSNSLKSSHSSDFLRLNLEGGSTCWNEKTPTMLPNVTNNGVKVKIPSTV